MTSAPRSSLHPQLTTTFQDPSLTQPRQLVTGPESGCSMQHMAHGEVGSTRPQHSERTKLFLLSSPLSLASTCCYSSSAETV
ncbi:unnamed protein product [Tilletia laevis]|uniref:Uncharacterized protein n=1 Tax=Tilletia controversa TaxID=13291 RepID=A0A8X7SZE3_9BASI